MTPEEGSSNRDAMPSPQSEGMLDARSQSPRRTVLVALAAAASAVWGALLGRFAAESVWEWIAFQVLVADGRYLELSSAVANAGAIAGAVTGTALALRSSWFAIVMIPVHLLGSAVLACLLGLADGYQTRWLGGRRWWWIVVLGIYFAWQAAIVLSALRRRRAHVSELAQRELRA